MVSLATAIARAWTWLYTAGLDPDARDDRRAQIESDIWEFKDDASEQGVRDLSMASHIVVRLLLGVPDDLLWRGEQMSTRGAVVAVTLGDWTSQPVTLRRASGFGVSATVHALAVGLAMWLAPQLTNVAFHGNAAVGTTVVFVRADVAGTRAEAPPSTGSDVVPEDNLGLTLGDSGSTVTIPGFTFNASKVIARAGVLFPFVTGTVALERIAATALLPRPPMRMVNPFGQPAGDSGGLPPLALSDGEFQALVDRTWARRERWTAFAPLVALADAHSANEGALPGLMRAYVEQNGLQPYVDVSSRDPRLWTQLSVVADHADFIDFISRYLGRHPSTKTATELLFLLDTLVQGSYDTLTALLDVIPEVDLRWTSQVNPAAYDAIVTIQQHYRAELEHRNVPTRASLRSYFDAARISILTNLLETTPDGYRANDARFLIGAIYWRQGRGAEAVASWSELQAVKSDRYADASAAIIDTLRGHTAHDVDVQRISRILDSERGRWISFSQDRLRQFGYRFNSF